jgi:hypothetical protein
VPPEDKALKEVCDCADRYLEQHPEVNVAEFWDWLREEAEGRSRVAGLSEAAGGE